MVISLNELLEEVISMKNFRAADFSVESIVDIVSIEEHFHFLFREVLVDVLEAHLIVSTIWQFDETGCSGVSSGVSEENEVPLVLQVVLSDWDGLLDQLGSTRDLGVGLEGVVGGIVIDSQGGESVFVGVGHLVIGGETGQSEQEVVFVVGFLGNETLEFGPGTKTNV